MAEQVWWAIGCAVVTAALASLGPTVIRRLPEPELAEDRFGKAAYVDLASAAKLTRRLAAAGAVVGALVGERLAAQGALAAWTCLAAVGVILGYVDARTRLLPTRVIAPSYLVVIAALGLASAFQREHQDLVRAALGWALMGGVYLALWFVHPAGLGYGDVRLSGLLGIALGYVGWGSLVTGLYAGFVLGGLVGLVLTVGGAGWRGHFAFGPFMLTGALVGLVWGSDLGAWYTSL